MYKVKSSAMKIALWTTGQNLRLYFKQKQQILKINNKELNTDAKSRVKPKGEVTKTLENENLTKVN